MPENQSPLNVDEIVSRLQSRPPIRVHEQLPWMSSMSLTHVTHLKKHFHALRANFANYGHITTPRRGIVGKLEILFRKIVRKVIYLHLRQQRDFNSLCLETFDTMLKCIERQSETIADLTSRLNRGLAEVAPVKLDMPSHIKDQRRAYVPLFPKNEPVLVIGCGQGELLALLIQDGVAAKGIEVSQQLVALAREQDLPVEERDPFAYLAIVPDESWGAIVIESITHRLSPEQLASLLRLAHDRLKRGGLVLIEGPFRAEALSSLLEGLGFQAIKTVQSWPVEGYCAVVARKVQS